MIGEYTAKPAHHTHHFFEARYLATISYDIQIEVGSQDMLGRLRSETPAPSRPVDLGMCRSGQYWDKFEECQAELSEGATVM
jgi:hypothetical protein